MKSDCASRGTGKGHKGHEVALEEEDRPGGKRGAWFSHDFVPQLLGICH